MFICNFAPHITLFISIPIFCVTSNIPHNILHILYKCGEDPRILLVPQNIVMDVNNVMHETYSLYILVLHSKSPPPTISHETPYCCIFLPHGTWSKLIYSHVHLCSLLLASWRIPVCKFHPHFDCTPLTMLFLRHSPNMAIFCHLSSHKPRGCDHVIVRALDYHRKVEPLTPSAKSLHPISSLHVP
jgi:hypothetical protein